MVTALVLGNLARNKPMTLADQRYTVTQEYCGYSQKHWVARFCDEWIGSDLNRPNAIMICVAHHDERERAMQE